MDADPPESTPAMRRHLKPLALLAVAPLLLHFAALGGLQWAWPQRAALPRPSAAMQVRVVAAQAPQPADAPAAPLGVPATMSPAAAPARPPRDLPQRLEATSARTVANRPAAAPVMALAATPAAPASQAESGSMRTVLFVSPGESPPLEPVRPVDEAIPHYRTQMPPPVLLRYELTRGALSGTGELLWRQDGEHYELQLDGRVGPLTVLTQSSSGGFDAAGLAPLRFTDRRLRRPTSAANFQREAGKITFSGPATELALHAGAQDRLSWMVQIAAIVAAEPALRSTGAKVMIGVVGAHADASVWAFRCVGREPVETGAGVVDSIKYLREPRDPYDTTVQVWLDPTHHYLPVHATQKSGPNDEGFSLRLQEIVAPP